MQLRHIRTLHQAQQGIARVPAVTWSPNNKRLAVADHARFIHLFDETGERRDKFSTKSADNKTGPKTYVVRAMAFSADSIKLAIAQSDYIIFVYKLGLEWGEKKSICNKFPQSSAVNSLCWPSASGNEIVVFATQEGKVKIGVLKTNKTQTLYSHDSPAISVASSLDGTAVISGHQDNSIFRFVFDSETDGVAQGAQRITTHTCPPYCLAWGETIAAAGSDCRVGFYDRNGRTLDSFDYPVAEDKDITCAAFNPSGQTFVAASWNRVRLFNYNTRTRHWEEGNDTTIPNSYSIASLAWKFDGSKLVIGTLCGAVDMFDACLRRFRLRGAFEFTYVSLSQVIVRRLSTGTRIVLKSHLGYEIQRVNVHKDRYLVANTATTLLIGDLGTCKLSEVTWHMSGKERFIFDNPQVCMVHHIGEMSLIEYGKNEILGTCRTDNTNPHRMSVRVHDSAVEEQSRRVIAYLIDRQTIQVDDLISGIPAARVAHQFKVDWLELNHRATKLLFRDKQRQVYLYDLQTQTKATLLNYCTYVQWVPDSDVVVAQNRNDLCVWYTIDSPDRVAIVPIKGDVEGIERCPGKTEVIVDEGVNTVAYGLDEALIEFGGAMEEGDYDRACDLLDQITLTPETEAMWHNLSHLALQDMRLHIAERCYAALGDVAKAHALNRVNRLAAEAAKAGGANSGYDHYSVRAELHILHKEFKRAEHVYLENGKVDSAMEMWDSMYRYDESISVAESRNHPEAANNRSKYFKWLMETHQEEKAGELKEKEGKYIDAINLYLKGGIPARAAHVVSTYQVRPEQQLLEAIASALFKAEIFEKAGDFFEKLKMDERAIDAYKRGHVFRRAVELARRVFPNYVVPLEDAWGDWLVQQKQVDAAINHYIEAHQHAKAIQSAISSRQWGKAVQIAETQSATDPAIQQFYKQIGLHYEEGLQLNEAEKHYVKGGAVNEAVEMYSRRGQWEQAHRVAQRHLTQQQIVTLFVDQAKQMELKGDYAAAERIYVQVNEPDQAIVMYKKARDFTNMIRLVSTFRPEYVAKTHISLGGQFEKEGNYKLAEQHYVSGKDWNKAVNMYRDNSMWDDAVRVAKVHGGSTAAKNVVLSRAVAIEAEEGVKLLVKFQLVEAGIDSALEAQKFDVALQWAQIGLPGKLPYVFLKQAMYFEDQGQFRSAEDSFIKAGKAREAVDMYIHQHDFESAMRVAESHDPSGITDICTAQARVAFQAGNYRQAEGLLLRANAADLLLKFYLDAKMYDDAQRIAKDHCPEKLGEVAHQIAMNCSDPIQGGSLLEANKEYELAVESYLSAGTQHTNDVNQLVAAWCRAVKIASSHVRPQLNDVLKLAIAKMKEVKKFEEAAKVLCDVEDFRGAVSVYTQGGMYEQAEVLANRACPDMLDSVKQARVQTLMKDNTESASSELEALDKDAALKAYVASAEWDKAMKIARQNGPEATKQYAAMYIQHLLREKDVEKALEVISRDGMDPKDFRFFTTYVQLAYEVCMAMPNDKLDARAFHDGFYQVVDEMTKTGQPDDVVANATGLLNVMHVFTTVQMMVQNGMNDLAVKVALTLPRYIHALPADKIYFEAGLLAKEFKVFGAAFVFLNRFLDISELIDEGETTTDNLDNTDFATTDFPYQFKVPAEHSVAGPKVEEVRQWVLTKSLDPHMEQSLPTVTAPKGGVMFEGSTRAPDGETFEACGVTGYPILQAPTNKVRCKKCNRPMNQNDWNNFIVKMKACPWCSAPGAAVFS